MRTSALLPMNANNESGRFAEQGSENNFTQIDVDFKHKRNLIVKHLMVAILKYCIIMATCCIYVLRNIILLMGMFYGT